MKSTRRAALVLFAFLGLSVTAIAAAADTETAVSPTESVAFEPDFRLMGYWQSYRGHFGFDQDESTIRAILETADGVRGLEEFSIPVTADEQRVVAARYLLEDEISDLENEFRKDPTYAGTYFDQNGDAVVSYAGEARDRSVPSRILDRVTDQDRVVVRSVEYSIGELEQKKELVGSARGGASVGISVRDNVVRLYGEDPIDPIDRVALDAMAGPRVEEVLDAPVQLTHCPNRVHCGGISHDWRGGLQYHAGGNANPGPCHSAFMVEDPAGTVTLTTAGHCVNDSGSGAVSGTANFLSHPAAQNFVGTNAFVNNSFADAGQITVAAIEESYHIFKKGGSKFAPIKSVQRGAFNMNSSVCFGASNFGNSFFCGVVTDGFADVSAGESEVLLKSQVKIAIALPGSSGPCGDTIKGASGTAIFKNFRAQGILSGCSGSGTYIGPGGIFSYRVFFSKIQHVENELGVTVLIE